MVVLNDITETVATPKSPTRNVLGLVQNYQKCKLLIDSCESKLWTNLTLNGSEEK